MSRRLIMAIEIDGAGSHPAAWRGAEVDPSAILTGSLALRAVQRAEAAGVDFATFVDTLEAPADDASRVSARLDALGLAARIAPSTDRIGLVPTLTVTHTEPFHVQASVATLDYVSAGRAGWLADVSSSAEAAAVIGRREPAPAADTWREARYVVDVSRHLWDSWEDDAIIRDASTGRFIDRDHIHYVDYKSPSFNIKGPSIVPRPPQGHPLTVVRVTSPEALEAAQDADIILLPGTADLTARLVALRATSAGEGAESRASRRAGGSGGSAAATAAAAAAATATAAAAAAAAAAADPAGAIGAIGGSGTATATPGAPGGSAADPAGAVGGSAAAGASDPTRRLVALRATSEGGGVGSAHPPKVLVSVGVLLDEDPAAARRRAVGAEIDYVGGVQGLVELVEEWVAVGVDGVHLRPASLEVDVPVIADRVLPALRERGVVGAASGRPGSLRDRLGLQRPSSRYAVGSKR